MSEVEENVELLRKAGAYEDDTAVLEDAIRTLLRTKPGLRTELAVEKYRTERVSLNRAAEIAGLSPAEFRELLHERGVVREAGFLSDEDRDAKLDDL
jgi:predicted HTH domain antitoxin